MGVLKNDVGRPSNKVIKIRLILKLIVLILIIGSIFTIINYFKVEKKEAKKEVKKYLVLDETKEISLNVDDSLGDIYITVDENNKYNLVDEKGNKIIQETYDYAYVDTGYIIASINNSSKVIDKKGKVLFENVIAGSSQGFYSNDYLLVYKEKLGLLDKNSKLIKKFEYDEMRNYANFYLLFKNGKAEVYDSNMNLLLNDIELAEIPSMEMTQYIINDYFITLKKKDKYQVYFTETKKFSKEYEYVSLSKNYILVNDKNKTIVLDKKGKPVTKYTKKYENPSFVTKDILFVVDKNCSVPKEEQFNQYGELYNSQGKKILKGCNNFSKIDDFTYIITEDKKMHLYNEKQLIFNKKVESEYAYVYLNEYGNVILNDKTILIYDQEGNQILKECKDADQLSEKIFTCSSFWNIEYIVDNKFNFIEDESFSSVYKEKGLIRLSSHDNKFGLMDLDGNKLLEVKYDNINITDDKVIVKYNNKSYIMKIKYVDKKTKKDFLKKNINIKEEQKKKKTLNYDSVNVNNIITTYKLESIEGLIKKDKALFKKFAYHTINNEKLSFNDKKNLLELFQTVIDYDKREDINRLLERIDILTIKLYKNRPDNMIDWAAGHYIDGEVLIEIIEMYYNTSIKHELMHFISHSLGTHIQNIYTCDNKIKNYDEIINMRYKEQKDCIEKQIGYSSFLEESGAEFISDSLFDEGIGRSYHNSVEIYILLQYILEDDFLDIYYNDNRNYAFVKLAKEKTNYDVDKIIKLMNEITDLPSSEYKNNAMEYAYKLYFAADEVINLYESKKIGDFKDNDLLKLVLRNLLKYYKEDCEKYLNKNPDKKLKNHNELMNLNFDENAFIIDTLKIDKEATNSYTSKLINKDNNIVIKYRLNIESKNYDVYLYFDKYGKVKDVKKIEITGPLG